MGAGQMDPMVASLVRTLNNQNTMNSSELYESGIGNTMGDSLAYSQTGATMLKQTIKETPLEAIPSEDDEGSSQASARKAHRKNSDSDEEIQDDIGELF